MKRVQHLLLIGTFLGFCWLSMWPVAAQEQKYHVLNTSTSDSGLQVELDQRGKNEDIAAHSNLKDRARYYACNDYKIVVTNGGHATQKALEVIIQRTKTGFQMLDPLEHHWPSHDLFVEFYNSSRDVQSLYRLLSRLAGD